MRATTLAILLATLIPAAHAKPGTTVAAEGFERPIALAAPPGIDDRLWIVEQGGAVWIIDRESGERLSDKPFIDLRGIASRDANEEGLLGFAFAPDFKTSRRFYINYSDKDLANHVVRLTAEGPDYSRADFSKGERILTYKQPFNNHNGGWIDFGPDGFLYIGTGDGGKRNDPKLNGQDLSTLLGKILRIDVSPARGYSIPPDNPFLGTPDARPEIWAYGLRNPWRCSFDRKTGDFWIADVGQDKWEEINWLPADHPGGANFGWHFREGDQPTPEVGGERPEDNVEPVYVYDHGNEPDQGLSVTGGYVYRGPVEEYRGRYFFADYQMQRVWSFVLADGEASDFRDHSDEFKPADHPAGAPIGLVMSFGEDNLGNVYILTFDGRILRLQ